MRKILVALLALSLVFAPLGELPRAHAGDAGPEALTLKFLGFNIASPGNSANIITATPISGDARTGLLARTKAARFQITVSLAVSSPFDATASDGTTAFTMHMNAGNALSAHTLYAFDLPVSSQAATQTQTSTPKALVWNFQVTTTGVIEELLIIEVNTGTG